MEAVILDQFSPNLTNLLLVQKFNRIVNLNIHRDVLYDSNYLCTLLMTFY